MNHRQSWTRTLGLAAVVVTILSGCKSTESQIVGSWNGANGLSITFKPDKTFQLSGNRAVTGTWKVEDGGVTLTTLTVNGKSNEEYMKQMAAQRKAAGHAITDEQFKQGLDSLKAIKFTIDGDKLQAIPPKDAPSEAKDAIAQNTLTRVQ